jgi:hypothetical protein
MTNEEYNLGSSIIWDQAVGHEVTCNQEISEALAVDLRSGGVSVTRVGRKARSRNKYIVFDIEVVRIKGLDMMFLSEEEAQAWHQTKNRSLKTLMKAPQSAFGPIETEKHTEMIWWSQAFNLAYRLNCISKSKEGILRPRGKLAGNKFGL